MSAEETRYWLLTALVIGGAVAAWMLLPVDAWLRDYAAWAGRYGPIGLAAFGLIFLLATLLIVPCTPLTIAGAVAFGWWAMPVALLSATLGSCLAFIIGRLLLRERLRALVDRKPAWRATIEAVGDGDWHLLLLMRLSPLVPFNAQNYALAVTDIGTGAFLVSTVLGMLPGTILCVYLGVVGRVASSDEPAHWISLGLGLVATVAAIWLTRRRVRERLKPRVAGARA